MRNGALGMKGKGDGFMVFLCYVPWQIERIYMRERERENTRLLWYPPSVCVYLNLYWVFCHQVCYSMYLSVCLPVTWCLLAWVRHDPDSSQASLSVCWLPVVQLDTTHHCPQQHQQLLCSLLICLACVYVLFMCSMIQACRPIMILLLNMYRLRYCFKCVCASFQYLYTAYFLFYVGCIIIFILQYILYIRYIGYMWCSILASHFSSQSYFSEQNSQISLPLSLKRIFTRQPRCAYDYFRHLLQLWE